MTSEPVSSGAAPSAARLGLGCAALGNLYAAVTDQAAMETLEAAWAGGMHYFDTAPYYGHGLSEQRLGRFLTAAPRDGVAVSSKVGRSLRPAGGGVALDTGFVDAAPFEPYFDYGRDAVLRQLDGTLARLGRDSLDIAFVHDIGRLTHGAAHAERFAQAIGGAFPALAELRDQGVVRAIGMGVNEVAVCLEALAEIDLDVILLAGRYTLLDQQAGEALLPLCLKRSVEVIVGGPYNSGVLAGGSHYDYAPAPPEVLDRTVRLGLICEAHGVSLAAAALHFPLRHPAVTCVIPGARSAVEVQSNLTHLHNPPPVSLWEALEASGLLEGVAA